MIDPVTLNARHAAAVTRYGRALIDADGAIPDGLLAELAAIADEHAQPDTQTPPQSRTRPARAAGRRQDDPAAA